MTLPPVSRTRDRWAHLSQLSDQGMSLGVQTLREPGRKGAQAFDFGRFEIVEEPNDS